MFPIVEYVVNYKYISEVLCVNKEKPIIGCNGKCYLMSELAKSAESEKPLSDKKNSVKDIEILFFQETTNLNVVKTTFPIKVVLNNFYSNLYSLLNCCSVFHPPSFIY